MKRKFLQILKKFNCTVEQYKSYRSDMGCQVFEMLVIAPNGNRKVIDAGYYVGSSLDRDNVLPEFKKDIEKLCS